MPDRRLSLPPNLEDRAVRVRLAHLSDPHLGPVPRPSLRELASKRVLGYINWRRNRARSLGDDTLARVLADVKAHEPDHILVSGDLVNIATDAEIAGARDWLSSLGGPQTVSVVPGNHDAYVPKSVARATAAWAPYTVPEGEDWPHARVLGGAVLIGVSSAVATLPLFASGRVGPAQLERLAALLDRHDDAVKIVAIHHPPDRAVAAGRRGLDDAAAVRGVLAEGGVDLVLHGHMHRASLTRLPTVWGSAAIVGVPSASSDGTKHPPGGWTLVDIDTERRTARLTRRTREAGGMTTSERIDLDLSRSPAPLQAR